MILTEYNATIILGINFHLLSFAIIKQYALQYKPNLKMNFTIKLAFLTYEFPI